MTNLRGYEIEVERAGVGGDPLNERASAIFRAIPVVGPIHEIRLDAWADGSLHLSLWMDEDHARALWEGKIVIRGPRLEIETREATPTDHEVVLVGRPPHSPGILRPPAAHTSGPLPSQTPELDAFIVASAAELREVIDAAIPVYDVVETPEERAARHKLNEPLIAEFRRLREEMTPEPLALLPLAPKPDPLAEFRELEPGAPLYDRASNRQIGTFESVSGDCVRLRSNVTGHTVISSGRAITRHERPVYEEMTPGDCRP